MHHHIRPPRKRLLQPRRAERRIHEQERAAGMRLVRIGGDVARLAARVDGRLEVDDVAGMEGLGRAVEREGLQVVELGVEGEHAAGAVVAGADADAGGAQEDVQRVEGGEAGGVGEAGTVEEGGEERFEAGAGGGGVAGVDVGIGGVGVWLGGGGDEGCGVGSVAEGCGYVEGWGDVGGGVEVGVGVQGEGGGCEGGD